MFSVDANVEVLTCGENISYYILFIIANITRNNDLLTDGKHKQS